jgi:hypothetical protein
MLVLFYLVSILISPFKSKCRLRYYWRWKSRSRGGRPQISAELRALIRRMSNENPLWGAPRIYGELLKHDVAQSSVAKYMVKRCGPPSQGWRTFLRNHAIILIKRGYQRRCGCPNCFDRAPIH